MLTMMTVQSDSACMLHMAAMERLPAGLPGLDTVSGERRWLGGDRRWHCRPCIMHQPLMHSVWELW